MPEREPFPWESEGETLAVETPEQTVIELPLAPFGTRLVAALLDQLLLLLVFLGVVLFVALGGALAALWSGESADLAYAVGVVVWFLFSTLAPAWWEIRGHGRTPGKRKLKLRTVMARGEALSPSAAVLRNLARLVDQIPLLWLVPALSPGKRRLGDLLAGTLVVWEEPPALATRARDWLAALAPSHAELAERRFFFGAEALAKLKPEDLDLIEYLGERLPSLPRAKRQQLLVESARAYAERLGMTGPEVAADPRRFLQELGLLLRDHHRRRTF